MPKYHIEIDEVCTFTQTYVFEIEADSLEKAGEIALESSWIDDCKVLKKGDVTSNGEGYFDKSNSYEIKPQ